MIITGCVLERDRVGNDLTERQNNIQSFFRSHKIQSGSNIAIDSDYAVMKNGTDMIAVIFGFGENSIQCQKYIEYLNSNEAVPVFTCIALN